MSRTERETPTPAFRLVPVATATLENSGPGDLGLLWDLTVSGWKSILIPAGVAAALVVLASFAWPVRYQSATVLWALPRSQQSAFSAMADALPVTLDVGSEEADILMAYLTSRDLQRTLITRHDLLPEILSPPPGKLRSLLFPPRAGSEIDLAVQREELLDLLDVREGRSPATIEVRFSAGDPKTARNVLASAITATRKAMAAEAEVSAGLDRAALEAQQESTASRIAELESTLPTPARPAPAIARELAATRAVYLELERQLALARFEESRGRVTFRVVDAPFTPVKKHSPRRTLLGLLAFAVVACLAWLRLCLRHGRKKERSALTDETSR